MIPTKISKYLFMAIIMTICTYTIPKNKRTPKFKEAIMSGLIAAIIMSVLDCCAPIVIYKHNKK